MRLLLFFLSLSIQCFSNSFNDFDHFQKQLSKEYVTQKIAHYLQYSNEIEGYYEVSEEAFILFATPEDKEKGIPEYRLFFGNNTPEPNLKLNQPLNRSKIAIDPGHFGGKLAYLEKRYVEMENDGDMLIFDEGTLSFLTALHLKKKLEEHGATVFLSRQAIGKGACQEDFFDWLKNHPEYWGKEESLSTIFRCHYNRIDLRERAKIINAFEPDLTVLIHYNALDSELPHSQKTKVTKRNFNLVFIPGAFCQGELASAEDRYHFLRLICTQDLECSFQIAQKLVGLFTAHLQVPPLKSSKKDACGFSHSQILSDGVFCRNLCLTRLIKRPLCYGETLIQNNLQEALALSKNETTIDGVPCPQRVIDVAEAYFEAISSYFKP